MVDKSGKTIWSGGDQVFALGNPVKAVSLDDFKNNPKLIENSWRVAAKAIIANIVKEL